FWSGAVTMGDTLNPIYDSGDGVHLNNAGHKLLFNEAVQAAIPNVLADTLPSPEFVLGDVYVENPSACGDSNTLIRAIVANLGTTGPAANTINFAVTNTLTNTTTNTNVSTATALGTCAADTLTLATNAFQPSALVVRAYLNSLDLNTANDTAQAFSIRTTGHPTLTGLTDSICAGEPALLSATGSLPTDHVLWYDSPAGGNILASGNILPVNPPYQTRYPEAVRGNLWFDNSLPTLKNTNINWNGVTFDIVASDTVTIDSLSLKINSTGNQAVIAYYRMGSEQGQGMDPAAWTSWGVLNLQVNNAGDFKILDLPDIMLPAGDTLGVYIHMQIPTATLAYRSTGSPASFQNSELQVLSGSGVAYTFGTLFTPRIWSGEVFYHHGFNPLGDCQSPRVPLTPEVFEPVVDLGNDTAICAGQNLLLDAGNFTSYYWNTHDVAANLTVSTAGIYDVVVTDDRGCQGADTIAVDVWPLPAVDLGQDTTICQGNSVQLSGGTFAAYQWSTGATTPAIVTSDSGTYQLLVTDANGCQNADSIVVSVGICVGLDEQDRETAMVLYPNPTSGNFSMRIPAQEQLRSLRIVDLQGRVVYQHMGQAQAAGFSPNLPAGSYLVEVQTTRSQAMLRLLVQ
ncbi:MAG: T9SS type A sorting domain-containing protein, partial [Bacteroidota bacterium]